MRKLATGAAGSEVQNNKKAQSKVNTTEPRRTPKPMRSCSGSIEKFERLRGKWQRLFPWLTASASSEDKMWGVVCSVCKHAEATSVWASSASCLLGKSATFQCETLKQHAKSKVHKAALQKLGEVDNQSLAVPTVA